MEANKNPANSDLMFSEKEVQNLVQKIAEEVSNDIRRRDCERILFVGVLKGAFIFLADLVRYVEFPCEIDFVRVSSYGAATKSSGELKVLYEPIGPFEDCDVYVVDEIIDTGHTLKFLRDYFEQKGAKSVRLIALLDKKERREADVNADFVGIEIPDEFVVGYGLDWAEKHRDLADIHSVQT